MKKQFCKSLISAFLVIVMVTSMLVVSLTPASAAYTDVAYTSSIGEKVTERLIEQGKRKICDLTLELGESLGGQAQENIEAFSKWFLMDAAEAAAYEAKQLCYAILDELVVLEEKITDYTTEISAQIAGQNAEKELSDYSAKWTSDVTEVMNGKYNNSGNVKGPFDCYYKYFLVTHLNETGLPEDASERQALNLIWENITSNPSITEADITDSACDAAKTELDNSFKYVLSATGSNEEAMFYSAKVNEEFAKAITTLSNNLTYKSVSNDDSQLTIVESAATYAYYALPYSDMQYSFVNSVADKQSMIIMILQMTYNEFLAQQGEYLKDYFEKNPPKDGKLWSQQAVLDNGNNKLSYEDLKANAEYLLDVSGNEIANLYDSKLDVDISSYKPNQNYDMTLAHYMKPEDAVDDTLTISGYESSHNYASELKNEDAYTSIDNNSHISNANFIKSNVDFTRVMSGGDDHRVYYVLSPQQFSENSDATAIGIVDHNVSRGETDLVDLYGNIHLTSCDYRNLIKNMSDGTNTFSCPDSDEISGTSGSLFELFDTPAFAFTKYVPSQYLSIYAPQKRENNTFIMTSTYKHNYSGGAAYPKYADIKLVDADAGLGDTKAVSTSWHNFENLKYNANGRKHSYILVVENNADTYLQKATLSANDKGNMLESFEIKNNGNTLKNNEILSGETTGYVSLGKNATIKPGNEINLRFKLALDEAFVSLKAVRNNKVATEEILVESFEELSNLEKTADGYYEFTYNMPYSDTTFVIETQDVEAVLNKDENGNFVITNYPQLCLVAENVNKGISEYVNGSYILANDITAPQGAVWTDPIGVNDTVYTTADSTFRGKFDGQGYTISNLNIKNGDTVHKQYGLFGQLCGAEIKNLNLENVSVDCTANYFGTIAGSIQDDSLISMCNVSGSINVADKYHAGGIAGYSYESTIQKCVNRCDIKSGSNYVGGICGTNRGTVNNCANFGAIEVSEVQRCGGIVGGDISDNTVTNCFNAGNVSGTAEFDVCSVSGYNSYYIRNCYYLDTTGTDPSSTAVTKEQFSSGEVTYLLNRTATILNYAWFQSIDNGDTPDEFPTLDFKRNKVVFKVERDSKSYSNIPDSYLLGDTDLDSNITIIDATLIQLHCAQLYELTGTSLVNADVNKDNVISITDATRIQAHIADIIPIE